MRCPRCGSPDVEKLGKEDIDTDNEGSLVTWRVECRRCGHVFGYDELIPREETSQ